jgi:hypothetical protein
MTWQPKDGVAPVITEPSVAQSLIFGHSESTEHIGDPLDPGSGLLLHLYKFDEAQPGQITDSVGSLDLNALNTPIRIGGKVGTWAMQYPFGAVNHRHTSRFIPGTKSFHIICWARIDTDPVSNTYYFFGSSNGQGMRLQFRGTDDKFQAMMSENGSTLRTVTALSASSLNTWYMLSWKYDSSVNTQYLSINNGSYASASGFGVYDFNFISIGTGKYDGTFPSVASVDAFHYWENIVLDDTQVTYMWNSGNGRELV